MTKKRRPRADSPEEQARYAKGAFRKIVPPDYFDLSEEETIFFDNVIDELPKADWTAHKIDMAAKIAQYMGVEAELQRAFRAARSKTDNKNIMPAQSSAITAAKGVAGIIASYRRTLGLQADGRNAATNPHRKIAKGAERNAKQAVEDDDDDLLGGDDSGLA